MNTTSVTNHTLTPLRWGIIGAGHIAREFADGVLESATGTLVAIGSRTLVAIGSRTLVAIGSRTRQPDGL